MATGEGQASRLLEDVERYAALSAALSVAAERYAQVLAAHGLDDEAWEAIDERWQARFSAALELATEGPPELMDRFSEAFSRALAGHAGGALPGARYAAIEAEVRRGGSLDRQLSREGVAIEEFLAAGVRLAHEESRAQGEEAPGSPAGER